MLTPTLTGIAFQLISALDSELRDSVSPAELKRYALEGRVIELLRLRLGRIVDFTMIPPSERAELNDEWAEQAASIDDYRKFGVQRNGICLLLAYVTEGIQRRRRVEATRLRAPELHLHVGAGS